MYIILKYFCFFKVDLALNVLEAIKSFYQISLADKSRNGVLMRKVVLESVIGPSVRNSRQLKQLADILGARRQTLQEMSQMRVTAEENEKLALLVERIARKAPEGEKIISLEWKIQAGHFYEQDNISDIIKGHHCIYKVDERFI